MRLLVVCASGAATTHSIHAGTPPLAVSEGYGLVPGLFPVNILHNLVHMLFGVLGLAAYAGTFLAVSYACLVAVSYGAAHRDGADPGAQRDLRPRANLGADVTPYAVIAAASAYFGFAVRQPVSA